MSFVTTKVKKKVQPKVQPNIRRGVIFECGDYKDKGMITPDDLKAAVAAFVPCRVNIEHFHSPFDGALGELKKIWVGSDETQLWGEYAESSWVADALGTAARRVSIEWDAARKRITGLALVCFPRVTAAALFAAFSAASRESQFRAENEIDWNAVDEALAQSGFPPAKRPVAAFSGAPVGPDDIDWQQVEAACASFTAWKPAR
jgi:hypothetical protein